MSKQIPIAVTNQIIRQQEQINNLRAALLLYHEAWNGCERNWREAMCNASQIADALLWPDDYKRSRRDA